MVERESTMKRIFLPAIMALALVSSVFAQDPAVTTTTSGTVVSASNDALVIDTSTGRMTFMLDSMLDRVRYNDLKPGSVVVVTHKMDASGINRLATDVSVTSEPPATTTTTTDDRYAASDRWPATASPIVTVALLGLAALAGGWAWRKKRHEGPKPVRASGTSTTPRG
jgi:MYXO-CTERM domain-containing protein